VLESLPLDAVIFTLGSVPPFKPFLFLLADILGFGLGLLLVFDRY
jgi:hypothetical protein